MGAMTFPVLIVDDDTRPDMLAATELPVVLWSERSAARAFASQRGLTLREITEVTDAPPAPTSTASPGRVLLTDEEDREAGAWWAGVLSRTLVTGRLRRPGDVAGAVEPGGSVVLALAPGLATVDWLEQLAAVCGDRGVRCGIVPATAVAARRHRLLGAAAPAGRVIAYTEFWDVDWLQLEEGAALAGRAAVGRFVAELTHPSELLLLQTHGNGADMPLGRQIVCARLDAAPPARTRVLPCFTGGGCLRGPGPEAEPYRFLPTTALRADTVVLDVCWGSMPDPGLMLQSATVSGRLLSGPWVRNLLAPTRVQRSAPERLVGAVVRSLCGASLGELALELNAGNARFGAPPSWLVRGEPDQRLPERLTAQPVPRNAAGWTTGMPAGRRVAAFELDGAPSGADLRVAGPAGEWQALLAPRHDGQLTLAVMAASADGDRRFTIFTGDAPRAIAARADHDMLLRVAGSRVEQAIALRRLSDAHNGPAGEALAERLHVAALRLVTMIASPDRETDEPARRTAALAHGLSGAAELNAALATELCARLVHEPDALEASAPAGKESAPERRLACWRCGADARRVLYGWEVLRSFRRARTRCDACGLRQDCPEGATATWLRVDGDTLRVWPLPEPRVVPEVAVSVAVAPTAGTGGFEVATDVQSVVAGMPLVVRLGSLAAAERAVVALAWDSCHLLAYLPVRRPISSVAG